MQFMTCDVNTYCIGQAASMGAVLLAGGTKGKRYALPRPPGSADALLLARIVGERWPGAPDGYGRRQK